MTMKRAVSFVLFGVAAAVLGGCPVYSDARDERVCVDGTCYACPDPYYSHRCYEWICSSTDDCPGGYTCDASTRRCLLGTPAPAPAGACAKPSDCPAGNNCGADNVCHAGDCATSGCPATFVCKLSGGVPSCVPLGGVSDAGAVADSGTCKSDADCPTPAGSRCLAGACVAPVDQCTDSSQCAPTSQCVQGACVPTCSPSKPCPTGYACDVADANGGTCTGAVPSCGDSSACTNGTVCSQQHCVTPCGAGGTCASGLVCVDGGCVPNPRTLCGADGKGTGCADVSICLRHACYIACDADAGTDTCKAADTFNVCRSITIPSGSYSYCGSNTVGAECNPAQATNTCPSPKVCIDGYCR